MQVTYTCVDGKDVQLEHEGREYSRAVSDKGEISYLTVYSNAVEPNRKIARKINANGRIAQMIEAAYQANK